MATDPNVILSVSLDGGAATEAPAGITATLAQTVQLSAPNKSTWSGGAATVWEIYDFPEDFALPSGWSLNATSGAYYVLGVADPPTFDVDPWGKYTCRVTAKGATSQAVLSVLSPSGLEDIAAQEGSEFGGPVKQWLAATQKNLRVLEPVLAGGGSGLTNPQAITSQVWNDSGKTTHNAITELELNAPILDLNSTGTLTADATTSITVTAPTIALVGAVATTGATSNDGIPTGAAASPKLAVRARMPAQTTIPSTLITAGGVTSATNDRILLDGLTTQADRGVYIASNLGGWARAADFNSSADIANGALIHVVAGTDAGKLYQLDQLAATLGSTSLTFSAVGGAGGSVDDASLRAAAATLTATLAVNGQTVSNCAGVSRSSADLTVSTAFSGTLAVSSAGDLTLGAAGAINCGTTAATTIAIGRAGLTSCTVDGGTTLTCTAGTVNLATTAGDVANLGNSTGATTIAGSTTTIDSAGAASLGGTTATGLTLGRSGINVNCAGTFQINGVSANSTAVDNSPVIRDAGSNARFAAVFINTHVRGNSSGFGLYAGSANKIDHLDSAGVTRVVHDIPAKTTLASGAATTVATVAASANTLKRIRGTVFAILSADWAIWDVDITLDANATATKGKDTVTLLDSGGAGSGWTLAGTPSTGNLLLQVTAATSVIVTPDLQIFQAVP